VSELKIRSTQDVGKATETVKDDGVFIALPLQPSTGFVL
jgi:thioredoxin reductase